MQQKTRRWKKLIPVWAWVCLATFAGCRSSQQVTRQPSSSKNPKQQELVFMDDLTISSPKTVSTTSRTHRKKKKPHTSKAGSLQLKYAEMMDVSPGAIKNLSLYNFIEDWYGVRYRLGGNDKSGIDCSAFAQRLYENVFHTDLVRTAFQQFNMCRFIRSKDSLEEGDLVFFRTTRRKRISHVGIYLMNNFFVHASSSQGVMISSLDDAYWVRYYAGAGKVPKQNSF